jgi:hypothetical protein
MIPREPYKRTCPDEERELEGFRVILFQVSNGSFEEVYDIDFYVGASLPFTVRTHLDKDSDDNRDYLRLKKWKEISPEDERYELVIGVVLNKLMPELTLKETRDLDKCLSLLEPTPEPISE